jgi:hypothetical protein
VSAEDQVIDVRTAVESSDLLEELPGLRVDDSDDDEPVLVRADGQPVDTWRERYPYSERMGREEYEADQATAADRAAETAVLDQGHR